MALLLCLACGPFMACGPQASTLPVANRTVEYFKSGAGRSVIFESGLGDGWDSWSAVVGPLSQQATVFAYSRAGYGRSSEGAGPRDGVHLASELHELIGAAGLSAPYVLVGHSLGGPLVQLYARQHPELVAGVVLVDGRPLGFTDRCLATLGASQCTASAEQLAQLPAVARAEYEAAAATDAQVQALPVTSIPVQVLTRSADGESEAFRALWTSAQADQARELSGALTTVPKAGHYIQKEAPSAVVEAVGRIP